MANADIAKYSSIKLHYLFCIIGIRAVYSKGNFEYILGF